MSHNCPYLLRAAFCLMLVPMSCGWSFDLLPSRFELTKVSKMEFAPSTEYGLCVYRPDSTSLDDFVLMQSRSARDLAGHWSSLVIWNPQDRVTDQLNFDHKAKYVAGRDVDQDGEEELVVSFAGDTSCSVTIYKGSNPKPVSEFNLYERDYEWRGTPRWDATLLVGPVMKQRDGKPLLLLCPGAGHGIMPRGVLAIDPVNGQEVWHYWIAGLGFMNQGAVVDLPQLEKSLYVFGTYGSANGCVWNGTNDYTAYLCALDESGHEIWKWGRPGPFTGLDYNFLFADQNTQKSRIFTLYRCVGSDVAAESLFCVDAASGAIQRRTPVAIGGTDSRCLPWGVTPQGRHLFLVWNAIGGLGVFDEELRLVRRKPEYLRVSATSDIDADGKLELLAESRDRQTVLLDDNLSRLTTCPVIGSSADAPVFFQWARENKYPYVLMATKDEVMRFRLTATPHYWLQVTLRVTAFLLLVTSAVWIALWGVRARVAAIRARRERERTQAWAAMASRLAHDVRTPLAVLKLSSQNLELELENSLGSLPEHLRPYFDTFRTETDRTENVARGLLKFTRQAPPALEELDLGQLIQRTVEQHPHSPEIDVRAEIETGLPRVLADHQQMISLVDNLMSNSLKAMKGKGRLTVALRKAQELQKKRKRDVIEIRVTDTGRGIPPQDLPRILEPYFSHSEGGTGLGLAIVKKIVEDHHGTINIQSTVGVGTTVTVVIPVTQENSHE